MTVLAVGRYKAEQGLITQSFGMSVPQTHPQNPGKDSWIGDCQNACLLKRREMFE